MYYQVEIVRRSVNHFVALLSHCHCVLGRNPDAGLFSESLFHKLNHHNTQHYKCVVPEGNIIRK